MTKTLVPGLALLCILGVSCGEGPVETPAADSRLQVFVHWQQQGLADRKLEILELGAVRNTNREGIAAFELPAGTFTLRAHVTGPGPAGSHDVSVTTHAGRTTRVEVVDCLPCVSPG
jgi:hypothetical protein